MKFIFALMFSTFLIATACSKSTGDAATGGGSNPAANTVTTEGAVDLQMLKYFNGSAFALGTSYTTPAGNTVTLSEVRYWVSNVKLIAADGTESLVPESYYLFSQNGAVTGDTTGERVPNFNLAAGNRENVTLKKVPAGTYTGMKLSIGVDSTYNNDLSKRAGELHLFAHMANITWSWVTSYIFGKTSGTCTSCSGQQAFNLEFGTNANYQTITLNFASPITVNPAATPTVVAKINVEKLFTGIDIGTVSVDTGITKRAINGFNNAGQMSTVAANFASAVSLVSATNASSAEADTGNLTLNVTKDFNGTPFALNTTFTDDHGNTLKFTRLRYWISNVKLTRADASQYSVPNSYYLMSENGVIAPGNINSAMNIASAKREQVSIKDIPSGAYTAVQFSVGVDPTYNNDLSLQAGELHIHQDMATYTWMWNSSYLFSQITGQCVNCGSINFAFDIGANANYKVLTAMTLPASITLSKGKTATINIRANVAKLFQVNGGAGVNTSTVSGSPKYINASTNAALMGNLANAYQSNVFSVSSASVQ